MNIKELNEALTTLIQELFPLNEMSNFRRDEFNLPVNIWIDGPRNLRHWKRLKFQNNYSNKFDETDLLSMTIEDEPKLGKVIKPIRVKSKDIELIKQWIILNKDTLLEYAFGDMSTSELTQKLKKL